ncbi:hypothetical protein TWF281_008988 [Arthrobotrys megalospora]
MHMASVFLFVGLMLFQLVLSETVLIPAEGFSTFVEDRDREFISLYKMVDGMLKFEDYPGIPPSNIQFGNDMDKEGDDKFTETLKNLYQTIVSEKEEVTRLLAEEPDKAKVMKIGPALPEALGELLVWLTDIPRREIRTLGRVWEGENGDIVNVPILTSMRSLVTKFRSNGYFDWHRIKVPLMMAEWLYVYRPVVGDPAEDLAAIDIDIPRIRLLAASDIATALKDIIFQGTAIMQDFKQVQSTQLSFLFGTTLKFLEELRRNMEYIVGALREVYTLETDTVD